MEISVFHFRLLNSHEDIWTINSPFLAKTELALKNMKKDEKKKS